ncbi:MAG: hypothetical protein ACRDD8_15125 [Bacteroidales bacterium]
MLSTRNNKDIVNIILQWCVETWGYSEYQSKPPKVTIYKSNGNTRGIKGEYISDKNRIVIFLGGISTHKELCSVMIHEYTHYLLNNDEYDDIYFKLIDLGMSDKSIYKSHPHEIKCRNQASSYADMCYQSIKKFLK